MWRDRDITKQVRGGIGDKVQQNHYEESDPTERTLTTGRNFDRF